MVMPHLKTWNSLQPPSYREDDPWQGRCPDGCGAAKLLGAGGSQAGHVPCNLLLRSSLNSCLQLYTVMGMIYPIHHYL